MHATEDDEHGETCADAAERSDGACTGESVAAKA